MFVGRIGTPIAGGRVHLNDNQSAGWESGWDHLVDLPRDIASAADFHLDFGWLHQPCRVRLFGDTPAIGDIEMLALGFNGEARFRRKIQCVGHSAEYIRTPAYI